MQSRCKDPCKKKPFKKKLCKALWPLSITGGITPIVPRKDNDLRTPVLGSVWVLLAFTEAEAVEQIRVPNGIETCLLRSESGLKGAWSS